MKQLFYAGLKLEKDLRMCQIFDMLKNNNDVIILSHGRKVEVIEMRYKNKYNSDREKTGARHIGFEYHYINIYYNGYRWKIEPAAYYPFIDENHPGEICAVPYIITADNMRQQCGYARAFTTLDDLTNPPAHALAGTYKNPITYYKRQFLEIYNAQAGTREKDIYNCPHILYDAQDDESVHIVRCAKLEREPDGRRLYFDIELKRKAITV